MQKKRREFPQAILACVVLIAVSHIASADVNGTFVPTGMQITPTAASGSTFQGLNPGLANYPSFLAGQAVATAVSPDGKTLLVLTSGYNLNNDANGNLDPAGSNEYVFVFDITHAIAQQKQVLQVPNTYNGIAWNPNGKEFYVTGGVNDNVHLFDLVRIPRGSSPRVPCSRRSKHSVRLSPL